MLFFYGIYEIAKTIVFTIAKTIAFTIADGIASDIGNGIRSSAVSRPDARSLSAIETSDLYFLQHFIQRLQKDPIDKMPITDPTFHLLQYRTIDQLIDLFPVERIAFIMLLHPCFHPYRILRTFDPRLQHFHLFLQLIKLSSLSLIHDLSSSHGSITLQQRLCIFPQTFVILSLRFRR